MIYKHTQIGYLMIGALIAVGVIFVVVLMQAEFDLAISAITFFILFILASFSSLKTTIDENYLRIQFGYGIFKKRFNVQEIVSVKTVKNHWYYGWGVRVWFFPYMWIFNVSGFDAVEIKMQSGKIYRIGTDAPKKLEQAITSIIKLTTK